MDGRTWHRVVQVASRIVAGAPQWPSGRRLVAALSALIVFALLPNHSARAQTHVVQYTPPTNGFRQGIQAEDYAFNGTNASVQVYQFRTFTGNVVQSFQTTLLRDWISLMHQEENVAGRPTFQRIEIPGADLAIGASFSENRVGLARPHMRMLIIAGNEAAIVDASAATVQSWQVAVPALNQMARTLRVDTTKAPAALTHAAGRGVAGLYMGVKPKYMATMYNVIGSGYYQSALHFYLFSADGRVCRAYDKLELPGGSISRFDFDAAERFDPMNSGRYTVDGEKIIITMHGETREKIVTDAPQDGQVTINTISYTRK